VATPPIKPKKLPLFPAHPERICWGCDKYCAADDLRCGNGSDRAQHPIEILGPDWLDVGLDSDETRDGQAAPDAEAKSDAVASARTVAVATRGTPRD
jgi:hypothetical protein